MMELAEVIASVCRMPLDFRGRGDVSMLVLLDESGYVEHHEEVRLEDLEAQVRTHPQLVDVWLGHSEGKRCSPAWYFLPPGDSFTRSEAWVVGYYPGPRRRDFTDASEACAFYIKQEAENLRSLLTRSS